MLFRLLEKIGANALVGILDGLTLAAVIAAFYLGIRYFDLVNKLLAVGGCLLVVVLAVGFFVTHVLGLPRTDGYRGSDGTWYGR